MGAGWSLGKDDRASAEKEAMNLCSQRGKACVLRTAFDKQCGALAADRGVSGWGTSADQREAQQKAIDECKKAGGARCVLHISFCSR
jgi:polygalacturonase